MYDVNFSESLKKLFANAKNYLNELAEKQKTKKETETENKKNSIEQEFESIDQKFKEKTNGLGLEKIEYDPPTDEEIKTYAENDLKQEYKQEKDKITDSITKAYKDMEDKKIKLNNDYDSDIEKAQDTYKDKKISTENKALKQGISRSSIKDKSIEDLLKDKNSAEMELNNDLYTQIQDMDTQIQNFLKEKEKAINDYELLYAAELDQKINKLKEERDKKTEEVNKYNNKVTEKEKEYAEQLKNDGTTLQIAEKKIDIAKKYFDKMPANKAIEELKSNEFYKKHLGAYYPYMLNYLNNKL